MKNKDTLADIKRDAGRRWLRRQIGAKTLSRLERIENELSELLWRIADLDSTQRRMERDMEVTQNIIDCIVNPIAAKKAQEVEEKLAAFVANKFAEAQTANERRGVLLNAFLAQQEAEKVRNKLIRGMPNA